MDVYVLNSSFEQIAVIDEYKSLIWSKRYYTPGDFELYLPATPALLGILQPDRFLMRDDDSSVMVVERIEVQTDAENGDFIIASGRSLESILARRVVRWQTNIDENDIVQGLRALITEHTGNGDPDDSRAFPGFVIDDTLTVAQPLKAQFTGSVLLDAVSSVCEQYKIGMRMMISGQTMTLSFYEGSVSDAVFSPEFDNLIRSDYVADFSNLANFALVAGEGEGTSRKTLGMALGTLQDGFALREMYVDARDLSSNDGDITPQEYSIYMLSRGKEKLAERNVSRSFDSEVEPRAPFVYKIDYDLGDIVTVQNKYGVEAHPRIVEIVESWDDTGYNLIPKFDYTEVQ